MCFPYTSAESSFRQRPINSIEVEVEEGIERNEKDKKSPPLHRKENTTHNITNILVNILLSRVQFLTGYTMYSGCPDLVYNVQWVA